MMPQPASEWRTVTEAWEGMVPLAEGGESTEAQRKAAQKSMDDALAAISRLEAAGNLTAAEAGLLRSEADRLQSQMYRNAPRDDSLISCYVIAFIPATQRQSFKRISQRLPLLKSAVESGGLSPAAAELVLDSIKADVAWLSTLLDEVSDEDELAEVIQARDEAERLLKEFHAMREKGR